jgi:hypothetical protein
MTSDATPMAGIAIVAGTEEGIAAGSVGAGSGGTVALGDSVRSVGSPCSPASGAGTGPSLAAEEGLSTPCSRAVGAEEEPTGGA